jgi:serine/threonine-protein kinase
MSESDHDGLMRILELLDQLASAWDRGQPIPLEALLRQAQDADREVLLQKGLSLELAHRRRLGENPTPDEYLARFPDDASIIRLVFAETVVTPAPESGAETGSLLSGITEDSDGAGASASTGAERIGKFQVIRRLGTGGQASALLARDPDFGRLVVLKRFHTSARDPGVERALQDGRALARLRSRFIPHCYGLERHGNELILVMEYIPGRNLSEVIRAGLPPASEAARLVEQVAEGLEAVHACGLVHRDIKPANIVVGDDGAPRLVDFGLAAHLGSEALRGVSGTPQYMAPEQARDQWERIDGRTDVFGLGAVLYALLTGQSPHPGATLAETLKHARQGAVTPPRALKPSIPRSLERIVLKAMAADSLRRYASAAELRQALRQERLGRLRRRVTAGLAGLATLILVAAAPLWIWWTRAGGRVAGGRVAGRRDDRSIRVTALVVERFEDLGPEQPPRVCGALGDRSFEAAQRDLVRVSAALSEPVHCFLVALNPDGSVQLCYPLGPSGEPDETVAPPATDRIDYPAIITRYFPLTEGRGAQAFVLFAAREPLPAFAQWRDRLERVPWADRVRPAGTSGVWEFDDRGVRPMGTATLDERGKEVDRSPGGLNELPSLLKVSTGVGTFRGLIFPVR